MAERSLGNKPDDQLSFCTLTDNGHKHKLNELISSVASEPNDALSNKNGTESLTHCGHKPSKPS